MGTANASESEMGILFVDKVDADNISINQKSNGSDGDHEEQTSLSTMNDSFEEKLAPTSVSSDLRTKTATLSIKPDDVSPSDDDESSLRSSLLQSGHTAVTNDDSLSCMDFHPTDEAIFDDRNRNGPTASATIEGDESFSFSYGDFDMSRSELELDPMIPSALQRTQLKCDKSVLDIKWRRARTKLRAYFLLQSVVEGTSAEATTNDAIIQPPSMGTAINAKREIDVSTSEFSYGDEVDESLDANVVSALRASQLQCDKLASGGGNKNSRRPRQRAAIISKPLHLESDVVDWERRVLTGSLRRAAITNSFLGSSMSSGLSNLELTTNGKDWLRSFRNLDPRYQILDFFNDLSLGGIDDFESKGCRTSHISLIPKILKGFIKSGIFSVWRPTSNDAIRKMITGEGTGKGLDIKGKSSKCGVFSGFVPFLQIHENAHKLKVGSMRASPRVRVFYPNESSRDTAAAVLDMLSESMTRRAISANLAIQKESRRNQMHLMKNVSKVLTDSNRCLMNDPQIFRIDDYVTSQGVYGLDVPEKLLWEGYVVPHDITRAPGSKYDTGRPSMPEFQQMNIETLRNWSDKSNPRPVLWHGSCGRVGEEAPEDYNPLCPLGLLMAYEEGGKVLPVVSDFDCFLLGTRGVKYHEPLGTQELSMLSMCIEEIEGILATPEEGSSWTQRWLQVKKKHAVSNDESCHEMPKFGYADPRSYKIMSGAVHRLKSNGAVRHGPECFNYGFPQDLDDQYLVISDTFPGVPWRYANSEQLIDILSEKVDQGFTFPLNPKWILCDPGWKLVYDKLLASEKPNVQDSMAIWYPATVRSNIQDISARFPHGFVDSLKSAGAADQSSGVQTDLAELELRQYKVGPLCFVYRCYGEYGT
ncbi:hypothetical protein ACHAXR_010710 [Thalassiosira sp. AJA248-18]